MKINEALTRAITEVGPAHDTLVTFGDLLAIADRLASAIEGGLTKTHVIREVPIGCHEGCAEFVGGEHTPEVNRIGDPPPPVGPGSKSWRTECPNCGTVLSLHDERADAVRAAIDHAANPGTRNG